MEAAESKSYFQILYMLISGVILSNITHACEWARLILWCQPEEKYFVALAQFSSPYLPVSYQSRCCRWTRSMTTLSCFSTGGLLPHLYQNPLMALFRPVHHPACIRSSTLTYFP